ncbi:YhcN/YlaJ family sporulation lipoprotein [Niallia endozanthoxylica]|uniref:Sporulation protein n=1 Tax=Niallia endozanthoxylica TaxID=2036016 RepID=A0A5J5HJR6_9BACI|nr:YhcN/YlaJ family sporulation lipoprotein [Niallia endozanthoxylica]KAA9019973.1 sporulation protein [Niallia endozanthoxylica]
MNKSWMIIGLCSLTFMTACQKDAASEDIYKDSGNTINVNDDRRELYKEHNNGNKSENFGYVRHQKSPVLGENMSDNHYTEIDREKVADTISKYCTDLPNVQDTATLVTDEEVLILYATDTKDRNLTADQVKKTGMSVVPRWYRVYVSDNFNLRKTMESYAYLDSTSTNAETGIDKLIKEMVKAPQGQPVSDEENANGDIKNISNQSNHMEKE